MREPAINPLLGAQAGRGFYDRLACEPSICRAFDGTLLRWGDADTPGPPAHVPRGAPASVAVAVSPVRPGHAVTIEYRVDGGAVREVVATPDLRNHEAGVRLFRAVLPGQSGGLVEFLPVLRFAGQPVSPRLGERAECLRYEIGRPAGPVRAADPSAPTSDEGNPSAAETRSVDLPLQWRVLSDGTACPLPIRFFDSACLLATFLVELNRAVKLLEGTSLKAATQEDGKAIVMLACFEYRKTDIGPYKEFAVTLLAQAPGDLSQANYISDLPVTTALSNRAGRELWGYNKFVAAIDCAYDHDKFSMTVGDSANTTIGALEGRRGASVPMAPVDIITFSMLNGRVIKTLVHVLTPFQVSAGDGFVFRIGTSRHPMADNLRILGVDGARPALVQYADPYQALLFPGRAI